jgi:HK97 family phage portal protein
VGILNSIQNIFSSQPKKENKRSINYNFGFGNKIAVSPSSALTFSAVWAAMRLLSESISSLPIKVCRKESNGDIVEVENDLSYLLKYAPNTYQNKITFIEKIMMDLLCNGNSYVRIVRNDAGRPVELLPLNYAGVTVYFQDNRVYYTSDQVGGTYESENMLHFKLITDVNATKGNTSVDGGIVGLSPIEQNANAISWGQSVEEYGRTFFSNGAKLSGVLKTDRSLSEQAIDRLRNSFNNNYAKLSGANQTAVLEEGLTYQPIAISAEQAQFLASRQFSIEEIARIFNVPPHLLKDLSKSSFNNIEMQSQEFVTYSLMPYLTKIETEMNLKLFRKNQVGKEYVKFNTNALLRGNIKDRSDYYKTAIQNGWMSINEVRRKEEMNKVVDGDKNYIAMNLTTIDKTEEDAS